MLLMLCNKFCMDCCKTSQDYKTLKNNTQDPIINLNCSFCDKSIGGTDVFTCKFCKEKVCADHIQLENHKCIKIRHVPRIRKSWLRKYGQNISTGRYVVVCDACAYVSGISAPIEFAGLEMEHHIKTQGCQELKVFLEEDVSHEKIPKNVNLNEIVPSDRSFYVCCHCRPPTKFLKRDDYISHHFIHN
jgi:hypothetical protein